MEQYIEFRITFFDKDNQDKNRGIQRSFPAEDIPNNVDFFTGIIARDTNRFLGALVLLGTFEKEN